MDRTDRAQVASSAAGTSASGHVCIVIFRSPTLSGKLAGRGAVRRDAPGNFYHEGPNGSAVHSNYNTATAASSSSISTSQLLTGMYARISVAIGKILLY